MKYFIYLFAMILLVSCATQKTEINKIEYQAGACFGFCPMFKLTITPNRTAIIDAERFTFEEGKEKSDFGKAKEGIFKTTINEESYHKLIGMLNDLKIKSLNSKYGNHNITDLPTSYLTVNYQDGTSKKIEDYGKNGTEKLKELWNFIEDLRKTQSWTKVQ